MNLFSQSLLVFCGIAASALTTSYVWLLLKRVSTLKKILIALIVAVVCLGISVGLLNYYVTLLNISVDFYVIFFVFIFVLASTILNVTAGWKLTAIGTAAALSIALLEVVAVNDFYHFYPTVASMLHTYQSPQDKSQTTIIASNGQRQSRRASLEQSLKVEQKAKGEIRTVKIPAPESHFSGRDAIVYLPPAYLSKDNPDIRFPVLILLNGTPGSPSDWLAGGNIEATLNNFAAHHSGITPVVVMPDHNGSQFSDTECVDSKVGEVETYLTQDVPSFIKQQYHVSVGAGSWAIGGLSEGGMCAAMLTLRHQDVFHHFLDMSGEPAPNTKNPSETIKTLFAGSTSAYRQHSVDWLLDNTKLDKDLSGHFVIGRQDNKQLIAAMQQTYSLARQKGLDATLEMIPNGGHSFLIWSSGFRDALPKLSFDIGATMCETSCPTTSQP